MVTKSFRDSSSLIDVLAIYTPTNLSAKPDSLRTVVIYDEQKNSQKYREEHGKVSID